MLFTNVVAAVAVVGPPDEDDDGDVAGATLIGVVVYEILHDEVLDSCRYNWRNGMRVREERW